MPSMPAIKVSGVSTDPINGFVTYGRPRNWREIESTRTATGCARFIGSILACAFPGVCHRPATSSERPSPEAAADPSGSDDLKYRPRRSFLFDRSGNRSASSVGEKSGSENHTLLRSKDPDH